MSRIEGVSAIGGGFDARLFPAQVRAQRDRVIGEVVDQSIQRSAELRAQRQEREADEARLAASERRRREIQAQQAEAEQLDEQKKAELARDRAERETFRAQLAESDRRRLDVIA